MRVTKPRFPEHGRKLENKFLSLQEQIIIEVNSQKHTNSVAKLDPMKVCLSLRSQSRSVLQSAEVFEKLNSIPASVVTALVY